MALVTLVVQTAGDAVNGVRGVFWLAVVSNVIVLGLVPLLPKIGSVKEPI